MADFRPGGLHRFGASLRSQCRSRGVWVPRSFFTASCSLGALQTAATLDKQILDCPLCACPCSHTEPSSHYNSIAGACQPAAPIICGLYAAPSPAAFQLLAHLFMIFMHSAELAASSAAPARNSFFFITVSSLCTSVLDLHLLSFYHTGGAVVKRLSPPHHRTVRLFARIRQIIHIFPCLLRKIPCGFDGAKP